MAVSSHKPALWTRPFALVALANLLLNVASAFALHLPGFLQSLGAREAEIGRIMAVHALAALCVGPLVGRVMDRRGRTIVIRAGALLFVFATSLYLTIDRISPFIYLVRVVDGISATLLYASLFTYAADVVPEARRTEGLGLFGASGLLPLGLGGQLGDFILAHLSYHAMFAVALSCGLAGLCAAWPLREVQEPVMKGQPGVAPRSVLATLAQRELLPIWIAAFAFFFAMASLLAFFKTYVLATGHGTVGQFFMVYAAIALALRVFLGWLPDRVGLRRMVLPALGCYALGTIVLANAQGSAAVLLAALLCGIGHSYGYPVFFSLVVTRARPIERGAAMTTYTCCDWAGFLVSGPRHRPRDRAHRLYGGVPHARRAARCRDRRVLRARSQAQVRSVPGIGAVAHAVTAGQSGRSVVHDVDARELIGAIARLARSLHRVLGNGTSSTRDWRRSSAGTQTTPGSPVAMTGRTRRAVRRRIAPQLEDEARAARAFAGAGRDHRQAIVEATSPVRAGMQDAPTSRVAGPRNGQAARGGVHVVDDALIVDRERLPAIEQDRHAVGDGALGEMDATRGQVRCTLDVVVAVVPATRCRSGPAPSSRAAARRRSRDGAVVGRQEARRGAAACRDLGAVRQADVYLARHEAGGVEREMARQTDIDGRALPLDRDLSGRSC